MKNRFPGIDGPSQYVWGMKDPRKVPLHQCASLGDMMATIEVSKKLDKKEGINRNDNTTRRSTKLS